jgi:hypothetical protein
MDNKESQYKNELAEIKAIKELNEWQETQIAKI